MLLDLAPIPGVADSKLPPMAVSIRPELPVFSLARGLDGGSGTDSWNRVNDAPSDNTVPQWV